MTSTLDPVRGVAEAMLRAFAPPPPRRWPAPGAMAAELDPATRQTPALAAIDAEIVRIADSGEREFAMIFMPPQEGKSQRISRRTPAWLLSHDPTLRIAIVSYADNKATRWGRQIRRDIDSHPQLGIDLRPDSRAANRWETTAGGGLICVGIGGGITGEPVDVLIIDDPVRGRAEAESQTYREAAWEWWESNGSTRLSARSKVILMMTRWHADDLAGRLLANEPDRWRVLSVPAIAHARDPIGRRPGEELQSVQDREPGYFRELKNLRSAYVWRSVFDQDPVAAEGNLFKRQHFRYWQPMSADTSRHGTAAGRRMDCGGRTVALDDCWRFATVDLAASTRTSADWTVASAWAIGVDGDLILLDRVRARVAEEDHFDLVRPLVQRWALDTVFVEQAFIGATFVIDATRSGVPVQPLKADTDKITRSIPATSRVTQHRVWFPAGADWLDEWCDELASFPSGSHDDQVDTLAYAARVAAAHWLPMESAEEVWARRAAQHDDGAISQAYTAATGNSPNGTNYLDLKY